MYVGEYEAPAVGVALADRHQLVPSVADLAAEQVKAPEQRHRIGEGYSEGRRGMQDRPVIKLQCRRELTELEMEQGFMPPDVRPHAVLGGRPERFARGHPTQTILGAPG